ncbi:hypothetical protein D187_001411 [Cystobacter fuscus DSM 2262]|uniref:Uncharacterized protein n=1 Tax=Cystobacter fuscus (strain ATCC 25194 / DSM 2262 / NBRC 100088 / M29) TaxID=1242864 RepID=S9PEI1_CYSF2|nr:DUF692 domain-containing protein [Cystobacter fuscus]EPX60762.1 hypothetical protein D187_001411 [Cystobacter fuscus DSM 2262]
MSRPVPTLRADALGLGLRLPHLETLQQAWPESVAYVEIISENYLGAAAPPRRHLAWVRERVPVVLHGVGLNLLGHEPLDEAYLDDVCRLADAMDAPFVSDHLCWVRAGGLSHHDLLPTPFRADLIDFAAERAAWVQRRLGRPFGLENLSSYVSFPESDLTEWEFYASVVREAGCYFMLDLNNIYVSGRNHGFDPRGYLDAIDFGRVLQVHLAGHEPEPDGTLVDTHGQPVDGAVWELYAQAWRQGGPFPTLLEWDTNVPPLARAVEELERAAGVRA